MRSRKRNRIREGNPVVTGILYLLVILICAVTLYPMYYVLILSVSAPEIAARMDVYWFPKGFSLDAYRMLIGDKEMWRAYLNTILNTVPTTLLMLATSVMIAYPLTYKTRPVCKPAVPDYTGLFFHLEYYSYESVLFQHP